jgi:hypothetical protein
MVSAVCTPIVTNRHVLIGRTVLPPALQAVGGRELAGITAQFTIEAWVKFDRDEAKPFFEPMALVCKQWTLCVRIFQTGGAIRAQSMYYPDTAGVISRTALTPGKWHHIAVTRTEKEHVLYVDGQQDSRRSTEGLPVFRSSAVLSVGSSGPPMHAQQLQGALGNIRIWSKALTKAELSRYIPFAISGAPNQNLWASYNFNFNFGELVDSSGNGHHLQTPRGMLPVTPAVLQPWERPVVHAAKANGGGAKEGEQS